MYKPGTYYAKHRDEILRRYHENPKRIPQEQQLPNGRRLSEERKTAADAWKDGRARHGDRASDWASGLRKQLARRARGLRNSNRHPIPVGISTQWIRDQLKRQDGKCFYTGIPFEFSATKRHPWQPSIDRKDSTLAYTEQNSVLCLCAVNYLKNDYDLPTFERVLEDIRTHRPR